MKKNKNINKKQLKKFYWSAGNAVMIILTFVLGSWFGLFLGMYSFLMGIKFCQNNWVAGMPKVILTDRKVTKEDTKR